MKKIVSMDYLYKHILIAFKEDQNHICILNVFPVDISKN
jgi:hypothetical protein